MRVFTLLMILISGITFVSAQAPFTGGAGDGYDRVSLSLGTNQVSAKEHTPGIYPQPARVGQGIELRDASDRPASWALLDVQGRVIQRGRMISEQDFRLATDALLPGRYFLRITRDQVTVNYPLTLQPR
jgi:hypothetical protein